MSNISSPALEELWSEMGKSFGRQVMHDSDQAPRDWDVLNCPTGCGKSQGVAVYCACLEASDQSRDVGVLIVTHLISEAEKMAEEINNLAKAPIAVAKHSGVKLTRAEVDEARVVVMTHKAFENALLSHRNGFPSEDFQFTERWARGPRLLRVIDEAVDIVSHTILTLGDIERALAAIDQRTRRRHPKACEVIERVLSKLVSASDEKLGVVLSDDPLDAPERDEEVRGDRLLWSASAEVPNASFLSSLKEAAAAEGATFLRQDGCEGSAAQTLEDLEKVLASWAWYHRSGRQDRISTGSLIVPEDHPSMVVLDATARVNLIWQAFPRARVITPKCTPRNYSNVELFVSRSNAGLGASKADKKIAKRLPRLAQEMRKHLNEEDTLFLCSHKAIKERLHIGDFGAGENLSGHHFAVAGRNDWQHCSAALVLGLPYRPHYVGTDQLGATLGPPDPLFFEQPQSRAALGHRDVRQAIDEAAMATHLVQTINRIRCRRVIDAEGNCAPCKVFLPLPRGGLGDFLLSTIEQEMPGVSIRPWNFDLDDPTKTRAGRPSAHEKNLLALMSDLPEGTYPAQYITRRMGGVSRHSFAHLIARAAAEGSPARAALEEVGAVLRDERRPGAKQARWVFHKLPDIHKAA